MIYTVTLNPAIDYVVTIDEFKQGETNRTSGEKIFFGGKGINVSRVLKTIGTDSVAMGFVAGFTGNALSDFLLSESIKTDFVTLSSGNTRINVKIKSSEETELNAGGPVIDKNDINVFFNKINLLNEGDTLILAGNVPKSLPENFYEIILEKLQHKNIMAVVDATGNSLLCTLKYKPFLIKPNLSELKELFNVSISTDAEIVTYGKKLQSMGAQNVLISLGKDGAILIDENGRVHKIPAPSGKVLNSVGAGDSMVAGFIAGYEKQKNFDYALTLGIAAGSATAFSYDLANQTDIENLFNTLALA